MREKPTTIQWKIPVENSTQELVTEVCMLGEVNQAQHNKQATQNFGLKKLYQSRIVYM